ncbi:unnamed protein product [Paramecium sonneborni]|uniref:Uncharacterized protein n=1 Tax=Paramecium sonneborni TaxID=65129 RepID=A0A8S1RQU1_9CILI|nr:unnamed protein product [Paramecium sonneborni]
MITLTIEEQVFQGNLKENLRNESQKTLQQKYKSKNKKKEVKNHTPMKYKMKFKREKLKKQEKGSQKNTEIKIQNEIQKRCFFIILNEKIISVLYHIYNIQQQMYQQWKVSKIMINLQAKLMN